MKNLIALLILGSGLTASATQLGVISELESNVTLKLKAIVAPLDPDVVVSVNVNAKKVTTQLPTTGMEAMGFFGVDNRHRIESSDLESVKVAIYTRLDPFPEEVRAILENSLKSYSRKGELTIGKLDPKTYDLLKRRELAAVQQSEEFKKIAADYSERSQRLFYILGGVIGIAILLGSMTISGFLRGSMTRLSKGVSEIKVDTGGGAGMAAPMASTSDASDRRPQSGGAAYGGPSAVRMDDMKVESLLSLLVDSYWCEKDGYANWVWTQVSPGKKTELLASWKNLASYVEYFSHQAAVEDRYHNDPCYLGQVHFAQVSNADLELALRDDRRIWGSLTSMRKESLKLTLKERLELRASESGAQATAPKAIPPSAPRVLQAQIEVKELTEEDEVLMFTQPYLVGAATARRLPSWAWVALLPREERASTLNAMSAQAIAECWVGPEPVLQAILEVMPEKKRTLFEEYRAKVQPKRNSATLRALSEAAIAQIDFTAPLLAETNQFDQSAA